MSECQIKRNFCMTHKCWVRMQDDTACPMSVLAAEVERLTAEHSEAVALGERLLVSAAGWKARTQAAGAEVERLTAALAERDLCDACNGTGQWVDYPAVACPKCHGHQHEFVARWVCECGVQDDPVYASAAEHALQAEVERLTDALHESEMAREELRKALAERDQRIATALAPMWHPTEVTGCNCLAHQIAAILRGGCDE